MYGYLDELYAYTHTTVYTVLNKVINEEREEENMTYRTACVLVSNGGTPHVSPGNIRSITKMTDKRIRTTAYTTGIFTSIDGTTKE